jgi:hypothetical protein
MIFKVFGKTNNKFSKSICAETVRKITEKIGKDGEVQFFDMDKPIGRDIALEEKIFYVPTVICEDDDLELGYLENNCCYNPENEDAIHDIDLSGKWWVDLDKFVDDMISEAGNDDNAV